MTPPPAGGHAYTGTSVARREDERFLTGNGRYAADIAAGCLTVAFVRSQQPHARITRIDLDRARRVPGVIDVYTGDDLPLVQRHLGLLHDPDPRFVAATGFHMAEQRLAILPTDQVHYVGQAVAAVVAIDRYAAEDAVEAVQVDYAPLPHLVDAEAALADDAPRLFTHLPDNQAAEIRVQFGGPRRVEPDDVTVSGTYRIGRHGAVPLECRGVVARIDATRVSVWTSTQMPHKVREAICAATGWPTTHVRVAVPDVGGGFGTKANVYAEEIIVPCLARLLGRDVCWIEDRLEHQTASAQGRDQVHHTTLTVDRDGHITDWQDEFVIDIGASGLWVAGVIANTAIHLLGPYRIPRVNLHGRAAFTNKAITAQYRGAGRPEACFALERSLDAAARRLGMPGVQIRRRNLLTADDLPYAQPLPYRDGVPICYDGGNYRACLDAVVQMLPASTLDRLRAQHPDERLGYGVGCYVEATGRGPYETARVRLLPTGGFEVSSGAASAGQSHETSFAQVAADALNVQLDEVRVRHADTDLVAHGIGTFASRSAVLAGSAIGRAAEQVARDGRRRAAKLLGIPEADLEVVRGGFAAKDGSIVRWKDLAAENAPGHSQEHLGPIDVTEVFHVRTVTWTMGAHAAIVGIHRRTGHAQVLRYAVAHEGGIEINPQVVAGQVLGGVAQGLGGALLEEFRYTPEGQPTSTTFADYLLPSTHDVPRVQIRHLPVATPSNPLGVRGVGEAGAIGAGATLAEAIQAALPEGSATIDRTPIDAPTLLAALAGEPTP